jgi:hypothetical protein
MNLSLLWWAHGLTGEQRYYDAAVRHSRQTAEWFVRPDGSTVQVVGFNAETGAFVRHDTHQGHAPDSCWSRGKLGLSMVSGCPGSTRANPCSVRHMIGYSPIGRTTCRPTVYHRGTSMPPARARRARHLSSGDSLRSDSQDWATLRSV